MSLLSDFEGHVGELLLLTPCDIDHDQPLSLLAGQVGNLFAHLADGCKVYWACASRHLPPAPFDFRGRQVIPVPLTGVTAVADHARWVQDPILISRRQEGPIILQPIPPIGSPMIQERWAVDVALARALAHQLNCGIKNLTFSLEGGNVLRLGEYLLIGKDVGLENGIERQGKFLNPDSRLWQSLNERALAELGGNKVIWVGCEAVACVNITGNSLKHQNTWQPLFHIDLFVLPAGLGPQGNPRLFLGKIYALVDPPTLEEDRLLLERLQEMLNEVESSLLAQIPQLEVAHLPIIADVHESCCINIQSLCNGWVEVGHLGKRAFLPDYRQQSRDDQYSARRDILHHVAADALAAWGFETRWIDMDFTSLARRAGALHCTTKVLRRTQ